jgi:hypothetical protein
VVNTNRLGTVLSPNLSLARLSLAKSRASPVGEPCPSRASKLASGRLIDVHSEDLLTVLVGHGIARDYVQIATAALHGE